MKVEKSVCGKFIRVSLAGNTHVISIEDWARAIAKSGEFVITPAEKLRLA